MIYWLQEATEAGAQGAASSWLLSAGVIGATVSLIGLILAQLRHTQTLRQTRELEDTRRLEARELEAQRASEAALQKYFEQMREALADPKRPLRRSTMGDNLSTIARAQTLAVLEGLDPERKRILLQFLYESNLIAVGKPIISLAGAKLREANLSEAYLKEANLVAANLERANLHVVNMVRANLGEARLDNAILDRAYLVGANLESATLAGANLFMAHLFDANLLGAEMWMANLFAADLRKANLRAARLSGTKLRNANLQNANLTEVDLSKTEELSQDQINAAYGDETTKLPDHLKRPAHWKKG